MAKIHILSSETIDKIAAGEVVERPASVVKELVENAIDARATAITVEARDGGIEFIRVTDNGCGMERDQLRRAFLRHATSKIQDAGDLTRLESLGFRGEALSSIAAVSKVEVITKTQEDITGSRILLEGAREIEFDEVGAPEGTTFLMRSLFFNTPVRRKFLKQPITEGGYIADLMEHLALSRPDISFKLVLGGQMKFHTSGNGDLKEVIYRIYGRDVANALAPIQEEHDGVRIEGYLGKPVQVRSNRNFEIYFINGRFIRSGIVSKALEEGYKEYLMQHKFPMCVLHITMDAARVDVNVHPSKMDVRFDDGPGFCNCLMESVRRTLRHREMIPEASLSTEQELKAKRAARLEDNGTERAPEPFERKRGNTYRLMEEAKYGEEQPKRQEQEFVNHPVWSRVKGNDASRLAEEAEKEPEEEDFFTETSDLPEPLADKPVAAQSGVWAAPLARAFAQPESVSSPSACAAPQPEPSAPRSSCTAAQSGFPASQPAYIPNERNSPAVKMEDAESKPVQLNLFEEKILTAKHRDSFRVIGQVFETYWMIEFEDKLLIIDQHAAHEKVNYERLMKQYHDKSVLSQGLLPPIIVSLSAQEEMVLKENMDAFAALGFEIESFGGSEYALRGVPMDLYGCNEREMFLAVLDGLSDGVGFGNLRVVEEKIASMSCKAAVKGNHKMSFAEAESLIDELLTLENPYNCPHGRPVVVTMTKMEMDRKFKRIVS